MDFTPLRTANSAPMARQVFTHGKLEASLVLRNGEQLLLALVIPIGLLIGARFFAHPTLLNFHEFAVSILGLAVWSSGLTSLAITTGFERRYGVLERLIATPLGKRGLMLGKSLSITIITLLQMVVIIVVAVVLGWRLQPHPLQVVIALVVIGLALVTFASWGLAIAGTCSAEITLGLANLVFMVGAGLPGLLWEYPGTESFVNLLPWGALGATLRALADGSIYWQGLVLMPVYAAVSFWVATKVFKWMS